MRIKEFSDARTGHAFRERLIDAPDGNVSVIQPKNILSDGTVSFSSGKPLRTKVSSPKPLKQGDVLVVNRGRFAATVFGFSAEEKWIVPSSILVLTIRSESILPEYIALYLNSTNGQKMFQRHYEHSTIPFISMKNLVNMDIPIPPLEKQRALVTYQEATREYALLSHRKHELYNRILSHELTNQDTSIRRREQ